METWESKVIMVTGGASGMGFATAKNLSSLGATVVIVDIREEAVKEAATQLQGSPGPVVGKKLDITDHSECASVVAEVVGEFGRLDSLVNCAGSAMSFTPFEDITQELYRSIMSVNLDGTFNLCQAVIPHFKANRSGAIVNFGSAVVTRPRPGLSPYTAAKAGVVSLTKTLALELAEYKIRVNCILPGATDSPMLPKFVGSSANLDDARAVYVKSIPMGRLATPDDIAGAATFLVSDATSFITGETLSVDGGRGV